MNPIFKITIVVFLLLNNNINAQISPPTFQWIKPNGDASMTMGVELPLTVWEIFTLQEIRNGCNFFGKHLGSKSALVVIVNKYF